MVPVSSGLATGATTQTKRATHTNKQAANNSHMWAYVHVCVFVRACVWSAMYVLPSPASELKQMPQHTGCAYKFFTKYVGIGAAGLVLSCIGCLLCVSVCRGLCPWPGQNKQHKHTWHVQWVFKRTKLEHCLVRSVWGSQTSNGI